MHARFRCRNSSHRWPVTFSRVVGDAFALGQSERYLRCLTGLAVGASLGEEPRLRRLCVQPALLGGFGRGRRGGSRGGDQVRARVQSHLSAAFCLLFSRPAWMARRSCDLLGSLPCQFGKREETSHLVALTNSNNLDPQAPGRPCPWFRQQIRSHRVLATMCLHQVYAAMRKLDFDPLSARKIIRRIIFPPAGSRRRWLAQTINCCTVSEISAVLNCLASCRFRRGGRCATKVSVLDRTEVLTSFDLKLFTLKCTRFVRFVQLLEAPCSQAGRSNAAGVGRNRGVQLLK